jgi:hypothetical protein
MGDNLQQILIRPFDSDGVGDFVPDKVLQEGEFLHISLILKSIHFMLLSPAGTARQVFFIRPCPGREAVICYKACERWPLRACGILPLRDKPGNLGAYKLRSMKFFAC